MEKEQTEQLQTLEKMSIDMAGVVDGLVVKDQETFNYALEVTKDLKTHTKRIKEFFQPMVAAAHLSHKAIKAKENSELDPANDMLKKLTTKTSAYLMEQDRIRRAYEEKALDDARKVAKIEREKLEHEALLKLEQGDEEKADEIIAQSERVFEQPVVVEKTVDQNTKLSGGASASQRRTLEVTLPTDDFDKMNLCRAIADGLVPASCVSFSVSKLKSWADLNNKKGKHHGCLFTEKITAVVRGA